MVVVEAEVQDSPASPEITLFSDSSSEELSIELLSMKPESLSSSSSMKSSWSSSVSSSSDSSGKVWCLGRQGGALPGTPGGSSSCSSVVVEGSPAAPLVSSHSRAGVVALAWVRAGWCSTSSAQRAWGGDVQITLAAGSDSPPSSPDHRRLPLARGSPIVECPLICSDISAHMMLWKSS